MNKGGSVRRAVSAGAGAAARRRRSGRSPPAGRPGRFKGVIFSQPPARRGLAFAPMNGTFLTMRRAATNTNHATTYMNERVRFPRGAGGRGIKERLPMVERVLLFARKDGPHSRRSPGALPPPETRPWTLRDTPEKHKPAQVPGATRRAWT